MQVPISLIVLYVIIAFVLAAILALIIHEIPSARRYLRLKRM